MRFLSALQSRPRRAARAERVSLQVLQRRKIAGEQYVALSGVDSVNPLLAVSAKYLDLNCHTYNTPPLEQYWFEWRVAEFLSVLLSQLSALNTVMLQYYSGQRPAILAPVRCCSSGAAGMPGCSFY